MKKELKTKLLKYGSVASALTTAGVAEAQIKYTDIPDTTVSTNNGFYDLDINQDSIHDFRIALFTDTGSTGNTNGVLISPFDPIWGNANGETQNNFNYPFKLSAGDIIDGGSNWKGIGGNFATGYMVLEKDGSTYPNSNWVGPVEDGFLGLRVAYDNSIHYGWARLDIAADHKSFTIKDFAVEQTGDSAVVVGEMFLSQVENLLENLRITQSENAITVRLIGDQQNAQINIIDLNGRQLHTADFKYEHTFVHDHVSSGIYILQIKQEGVIRNEKFLIR